MTRLLIAGNWKMNTTATTARELASSIAGHLPEGHESVDVLVSPPFPYLPEVAACLQGTPLQWGAQNVFPEPPGAFTGEVAVEMLTDTGCSHVIVGHSERRHVLQETDDFINRKVQAALRGRLTAILCVGELLSEREAGETETVLERQIAAGLHDVTPGQMADVVIAYEPVWAIGTGKTATPEQAQDAHSHLRKWLESHYNSTVAETTRILYGGSVKPDNAAELLNCSEIDGGLIGGASLKADAFLEIVSTAVAVSSSS